MKFLGGVEDTLDVVNKKYVDAADKTKVDVANLSGIEESMIATSTYSIGDFLQCTDANGVIHFAKVIQDIALLDPLVNGTNILFTTVAENLALGTGCTFVLVTQAEYDALPISEKVDSTKMYVITDSESSPSVSFADLDDVSFTNLQNGQVPKWNSTTQQWENGQGGSATSSLADLTDVTLSSNVAGQQLQYNGINWVNNWDDYFNSDLASAEAFVNGTANIPQAGHSFGKFFKVKDVNDAFGLGTNMWLRGFVVYQNNTANPYTSITGGGIVYRNDVATPYTFYIGGNGTVERPYSISTSLVDRGYDANAVHWYDQAKLGAKNILQNTADTQTINDVVFTVNSDGTVTTSGTQDGSGSGSYFRVNENFYGNGSYKLSGCPADGSANTYRVYCYDNDTSSEAGSDTGSGGTLTLTSGHRYTIIIYVGLNQTVEKTFKPMITLVNDTESDYAHYVPYAMTNRELTKAVGGIRERYSQTVSCAVGDTEVVFTDVTYSNTATYEVFGDDGTGLGVPIAQIWYDSNNKVKAVFSKPLINATTCYLEYKEI